MSTHTTARYAKVFAGTAFSATQQAQVYAGVLKAHRWQYIVSGEMEPRFQKNLFGLIDAEQGARIRAALAPRMYAVPQPPEVPLPMAA